MWLGAMGPAARGLVPALRERLRDDAPVTPIAAAEAMAKLDPKSDEPVAALRELLADRTARVSAARTLAGLGERAKPAADALRKLLDDPHAAVRDAAREALRRIEPTR